LPNQLKKLIFEAYFQFLMAKFSPLKVKDIKRETPDAVSVAFDVPPTLQIPFQFKQGQYITLKLNINGEELRRSYSICTSPYTEKELRVAIKEVNGGKMSTYINKQLKVGDIVDVMTPMGNFHSVLSGSNKKNYVLMAGGSGITPMMSILKSILHIEKQSHVTLIYANRNEESVIFAQELEKIAQANPSSFKLLNVYDVPKNSVPEIQSGLITIKKAKALLEHVNGTTADEYFICGPGPLMENIKTALESMNVAKEKIHIEYFSSVIEAVEKAEGKGSDVSVNSKVTVIQYGFETTFDLDTGGSSILDASIEAGVDAPFSCKGAVCCTCRAKIIEGKVKMDANFALTDAEVEEGFVLTCQSHPLTEKVVIDFDAI
jgi:ring-1,2-phenylacetyl-CoA epoxidase subunit PaaE